MATAEQLARVKDLTTSRLGESTQETRDASATGAVVQRDTADTSESAGTFQAQMPPGKVKQTEKKENQMSFFLLGYRQIWQIPMTPVKKNNGLGVLLYW